MLNLLPNGDHPLNSGVTDSAPMVINTDANSRHPLRAAHPRLLRPARNLALLVLPPWRCSGCFTRYARAVPLAQDGRDLLEVAQQQKSRGPQLSSTRLRNHSELNLHIVLLFRQPAFNIDVMFWPLGRGAINIFRLEFLEAEGVQPLS